MTNTFWTFTYETFEDGREISTPCVLWTNKDAAKAAAQAEWLNFCTDGDEGAPVPGPLVWEATPDGEFGTPPKGDMWEGSLEYRVYTMAPGRGNDRAGDPFVTNVTAVTPLSRGTRNTWTKGPRAW